MARIVETPRIFVACLASHNNGKMHGTWIDADQDEEDIRTEIQEMLTDSSEEVAEEWRIDDTDNFDGFNLREYENLETVSRIGKGIAEHGTAFAAYASWMQDNGSNAEATSEHFQQCSRGHWDSEEDFALKSGIAEERYGLNEIPTFWQNHIDWDSVATEIFTGGYEAYPASPFGIYVFENY